MALLTTLRTWFAAVGSDTCAPCQVHCAEGRHCPARLAKAIPRPAEPLPATSQVPLYMYEARIRHNNITSLVRIRASNYSQALPQVFAAIAQAATACGGKGQEHTFIDIRAVPSTPANQPRPNHAAA